MTDFDASDTAEQLDLSGVATILNFADLAANHMSQSGAHVVIDAGNGDSITLLNVQLSDLDVSDFIF
ncbi:hypothetical protein [Parasedimentitalea marina]|uniref:hypothetical protein n=1 Tax=Parasedimentitalea marina TaxID=2483033 RepID=UPI003B848AEA